MPEGKPQKGDPPEVLFDPFWRVVLVLLRVALLIAAAVSWWNPPKKLEFAPQATSAKTSTTAKVDDRSETTTGLLLGLAVLCVVIAANGRKLTSVKIAGQEFSTDPRVARAAGEAGGRAEEKAIQEGFHTDAARQAALIAQDRVFAQALTTDVNALDLDSIAQSAVDARRIDPKRGPVGLGPTTTGPPPSTP